MLVPAEDRPADLAVGCLRLWVLGRQFEQTEDFWDGNWLAVEAEASAAGALVRTCGPLVHLSELERFEDECRRLHETLDGQAELVCMEPNIRVRLQSKGLGHLRCEVFITPDHMTQRHEFIGELDQTHLPAIIHAIQDVLRRLPVRSRPSEGV